MHPGEVQGDLWRVPAVRIKAGKEHVVPLVKEALEQLPFQPVSDVSLSKCIRRHTALPATTHGMRSTFRDWCGERLEQGGSDRAIASRLRRQSWSAESGISDVNRSLSYSRQWREYPRVRHRREFAPPYGKRRRAVDAVRRRNRRREMNRISLVRKSSGLVVRFPGRVRGSLHLAAKTALARVAFATCVQAGDVEDIPLDEVA